MRNLLFVCAGLLVVSGIVSTNLWRELRAERQLTVSLRAQLDERQAALSEAAASAARMQAASPPVTYGTTQAVRARSVDEAPVAGASQAPPPTPASVDVARILNEQQELLKDPEYRKARLAQTRMSLPQTYPGLIEELGLTAEEADRLFDLLAESQLELSQVSMLAPVNGVAPDRAAIEEAGLRAREVQTRQEEQLSELLGGARYAQWRDYQQTRAPRLQASQVARNLESVGAPLRSEQSRPLTAAYIAEQQRMQEETRRLLTAQAAGVGPADQARFLEERFKLQAESNRRIVDAMKPHLDPPQLQALQTSLEQQLVMNRASTRVIQTRMDAQGGVPAQGVTTITMAVPAGAVPPPPPP